MRCPILLLLLATTGFAQAGKAVDQWDSPHNQKRLRMEWDALPDYKPTKLPDGSEEPPRAPWPFAIYLKNVDSKGSEKMHERVFLDTAFVIATHAVKVVQTKPAQAIELPYLASLRGIQDPTLVFLDRDFEVVGMLNQPKDFSARRVLPYMAKAADEEYQVKLTSYIRDYMDLIEEGEKLWKTEERIDALRERAGKAGEARGARYDAEADELEKELNPLKDELAAKFDELRRSLRFKEEAAAALPTTTGSGRGKRKLTPQEIEAIEVYREFSRNDNPIVRAAAVEDLGAIDSGAMVEVILDAANDTDPRVVEAAGKALGQMKSAEALDAMTGGLGHANTRSRTAAVLGFSYVRKAHPAAVPLLIKRLQDGSAEVRRAALLALENQKDPSAVPALIEALDDREEALGVLAAKALGTIGAAEAAQPLIGKLDASDWSLQKAAIEALAQIRPKEAIGPLLERFGSEKGLVVEVIYKALVAITGQDFKYNVENWKKWWDRYGGSFEVPTPEEIRIAKEKRAKAMEGYYDPRERRKYHKIETLSRKMVFVIDISASMRDKIVIPPYAPQSVQDEFPDRVKWNIAEKELTELLATLDRNVYFNIITFAGKVDSWKDSLVSGASRTAAIKFVAKLEPMEVSTGGGRRGVSAGGGDEQKTNTYEALMAAFGQAEADVPNWKARTKVDTIFLVTDGTPTIGAITDVRKLVDHFTELNRTRGIVIHVVCFDRDALRKLKPLAEQNGGQAVLRGWDPDAK